MTENIKKKILTILIYWVFSPLFRDKLNLISEINFCFIKLLSIKKVVLPSKLKFCPAAFIKYNLEYEIFQYNVACSRKVYVIANIYSTHYLSWECVCVCVWSQHDLKHHTSHRWQSIREFFVKKKLDFNSWY